MVFRLLIGRMKFIGYWGWVLGKKNFIIGSLREKNKVRVIV